MPGEQIVFVQVADAPRLQMDVLSWSRHFRCFPGQGDLDVAGFLAAVLASGYGGPVSLEVFNDEFRAASTRQTAVDGRRGLLFLEEQTRERMAAAEAPAALRAARSADLFAPPPPSACEGLEFVEFAADDSAAARLGCWLERLGFAAAGRHRSKDVTLYRQGAVNLVVNAEPEFAGPRLLPGARALGVRAGLPPRGRHPGAQPRPPLPLPALRGPDRPERRS